jgi:hypothetical protein
MQFEMFAGERASRGFAVTQPGAIKIQLQATGVPLVLSLRRPDGRMIERPGSGQIVIDDTASAADIAKGQLWGIGIRAAQETPRAPQSAGVAPMAQRPVASGTLSVQHPAADAARVKAALTQAQADTVKNAAARPAPSAPQVDARALALQAQAAQDKQVAQKHAASLAQLRPTLPAEVHAQINQRIGLRLNGQTLQQASAAVPVRLVKAGTPGTLAITGAPRPIGGGLLTGAKTGIGTTQSASTGGAAPVGSGGGVGSVASADTAAPALSALSVSQGDPATPMVLSGNSLGDAPGEVHFIVGNGKDIAAPVTYWSGSQIVTEVPYADGIPEYNGQVYVKRSDGVKTALLPFHFVPLYDVAEIGFPDKGQGDYSLGASAVNYMNVFGQDSVHQEGAFLWGFTGNDKFYARTQLRNGWTVVEARIAHTLTTSVPSGGAYVVDARPGTTSPYVNVRWWVDGGYGMIFYTLRVAVKRPKNLPCSANPCPIL